MIKDLFKTRRKLIRELVFLKRTIAELNQSESERRRANEALRSSEERYRSLASSVDSMSLVDRDCRYIFMNEGCRRKFNLPLEDIIGKRYHDFHTDENSRQFAGTVKKVFETGKPIQMEHQSEKDKSYLLRTFSPVMDKEGQSIIAVTIGSKDITDLKKAEEDQRKLEKQLIEAHKMEALGTLAGGIAHDFNNILSGIMGYAELTLKTVPDRSKSYHNLEQILRAAERAKDLVRQILTFSRKAVPKKKPVSLPLLVDEAVRFMRASLPTTIEIKKNNKVTYGTVLADPTQLHQVMINLCANAGYAMREAGGILEIGLEEAVIDEDELLIHSPLQPGQYLVLAVRDTGCGIPPENLPRIFDPYFTTKGKGQGTGLGLAVVHGIVKDHGGGIKVCSEPDRGTTFSIYLPMLDEQAEDDNIWEEENLLGKGETVMFLDDEKMVVDSNRELLEQLGYRVVTETDPVKAFEVFKNDSNAFDLVITDKNMPHMTGFDLVREIRRIRADIPVIISSGFQEPGDMEKLATLGAVRMVTKPMRMGTLVKIIRNILEKT